ncbi:hypothetical protein ACLGGT_13650 [Roseovarius sp. MS2]|uniref:hypothetical protein n=1 Tax=Roseovarius sp. MS2 TaxID=3390728 RepID=UPI003EDB7931
MLERPVRFTLYKTYIMYISCGKKSGLGFTNLSTNDSHLTINTGTALALLTTVVLGAITTLSPPYWLSMALIIWVVLCPVAALVLSDAEKRNMIAHQLEAPSYTQLYTYFMKGSIKWVWRRFCNPVSEKAPWVSYFRAAMTWRLYDRAILLAVAYPILLMVGQWTVTGAEGRLDGLVVLPGTEFWPNRAAFLFMVILLIVGIAGTKRMAASEQPRVRRNAGWLLILAFVFAFAIAVAFVGAFSFAFAGAFSAVVAIAFAGAYALVVEGTFAVVFAGAFASAFAVAVAFGVVLSGAFVGAFTVGFAVAGAMVLTVPIVFAVEAADKRGRQGIMRLLIAMSILIAAIAVTGLFDWSAAPDNRRAIFLFLGMLPIFNALFDVVSYALTLSLIRFGLRSSRPWLWGLVDLSLAGFLFLALGTSLVAIIHGLNQLASVPLIDLQALFGSIYERPAEYIWLYLMLFSTILPTGLHAVISLISLQGIWPYFFRDALSSWIALAPQSPIHAIGAILGLGAFWAAPIAGAAGIIWLALHFGWGFLLSLMEGYFNLLLWLAAIPLGAI